MAIANPGDLINPMPGVLRIQARTSPATLSHADTIHLGRIKGGHRQTAAGVVLIDINFRELFIGDAVAEAGGKTEAGQVKAGAGGHRGVLQARVADAKLAEKTWGEIGDKADA